MRSALLLCVVLGSGGGGAGRIVAQQLTATELGAGGALVAARRTFAGLELGLARRTGGQGRLALAVAGGVRSGRAALRVQGTTQFVLTPAARSGIGPYLGVGAAFAGAPGQPGAGYLALVLGLEAAPGRRDRGGWYAELGVAGGVRAAAGWRWRRFPAWWR